MWATPLLAYCTNLRGTIKEIVKNTGKAIEYRGYTKA